MQFSKQKKSNFLDALKYTEEMQNKSEVFKAEEKQLSNDLSIFEVVYTPSVELHKLQDVRNEISF